MSHKTSRYSRSHHWHRYRQEHPAFDRPRRPGGNVLREKIARGRIAARLANVPRCFTRPQIGCGAGGPVRASTQRRYVCNAPRVPHLFAEDQSSRAGQTSVFCSNNG